MILAVLLVQFMKSWEKIQQYKLTVMIHLRLECLERFQEKVWGESVHGYQVHCVLWQTLHSPQSCSHNAFASFPKWSRELWGRLKSLSIGSSFPISYQRKLVLRMRRRDGSVSSPAICLLFNQLFHSCFLKDFRNLDIISNTQEWNEMSRGSRKNLKCL